VFYLEADSRLLKKFEVLPIHQERLLALCKELDTLINEA
jgi:hypothetical protein